MDDQDFPNIQIDVKMVKMGLTLFLLLLAETFSGKGIGFSIMCRLKKVAQSIDK